MDAHSTLVRKLQLQQQTITQLQEEVFVLKQEKLINDLHKNSEHDDTEEEWYDGVHSGVHLSNTDLVLGVDAGVEVAEVPGLDYK